MNQSAAAEGGVQTWVAAVAFLLLVSPFANIRFVFGKIRVYRATLPKPVVQVLSNELIVIEFRKANR